MPPDLVEQIAPFLTKTTAIVTGIILLIIISAFLVVTERRINRATVEKLIKTIRSTIKWLIWLEFGLGFFELVKFALTFTRSTS